MKLQASHHGRDGRHQAPPAVQTWSYRLDKAASYDSNLGNAELVLARESSRVDHSDRPATKVWRPGGPVMRATSILSTAPVRVDVREGAPSMPLFWSGPALWSA